MYACKAWNILNAIKDDGHVTLDMSARSRYCWTVMNIIIENEPNYLRTILNANHCNLTQVIMRS